MDVCFGGQQPQRLLRGARGVGRPIVGERCAAFVVGIIRGLALPQPCRRRLVAFAAEIAASCERRRGRAVLLDALGRRGMAREQRREAAAPAAVLLGQAHERLLQRDGRVRVVAGRGHVAHAVEIRFELRFAAVAHRQELRAEACGADGEAAVVAALRGDLRREQRALQQETALHRERAMPRCRVHDLVAEHGRELGLGRKLGEQAAIHGDLAAGQRPCVRHGAVQDDELVRQLPIADGGELLADFCDVSSELRIECVLAALHLLRRLVLLLADRDLLIGGNERELAIAGHGVDDAAAQHREHEGGRKKDQLWLLHITHPVCPVKLRRRKPTEVPLSLGVAGGQH